MTSEFIEQDVIDAAYNLVSDYPGGSRSLAPRIGKSVTALSHEVTKTGSAKFGLETAVRVTELTGDLRILQAWNAHAGYKMVPIATQAQVDTSKVDATCLERLGVTAKEFGEVCSHVAGSLADNKINDNELASINRECGELIAALHAMRMAIYAKNKETKQKHFLKAA